MATSSLPKSIDVNLQKIKDIVAKYACTACTDQQRPEIQKSTGKLAKDIGRQIKELAVARRPDDVKDQVVRLKLEIDVIVELGLAFVTSPLVFLKNLVVVEFKTCYGPPIYSRRSV